MASGCAVEADDGSRRRQAVLIDNLSPSTISQLESDANVSLARRAQSSLCYLAMNNLKPPFDNPKVREAVAYAINKERIIQLAYKGYAKAAKVPMPPGFLGYNEALVDRPYDPEKAKALLREAGLLPPLPVAAEPSEPSEPSEAGDG